MYRSNFYNRYPSNDAASRRSVSASPSPYDRGNESEMITTEALHVD